MSAAALLACVAAACGSRPAPPADDVDSVAYQPRTSGTLAFDGLSAPVSIVRDRWGIPHITASNTHDLFFAQGFVQAQDRLFQMDLWRRSVQGRLSEVLGANFIERDAMTRRVQYRGPMDREWASYGPEARAIAEAFVQGVNAQVALARNELPEEFQLAGWKPEVWRADDLTNRTSAFTMSASAEDDVFRARLAAAIGLNTMARVLPEYGGRTARAPLGVDLGAMTFGLGDNLRRVGPPPVFAGFAAPFRLHRSMDGDAAAVSLASGDVFSVPPRVLSGIVWGAPAGRTENGAPLIALSLDGLLEIPSSRYLVHLKAPGWNAIGAAAPWAPGVIDGHNDDVAWVMAPSRADVQDVYVERTNPQNPRQVQSAGRWVDMDREADAIPVKGRSEPFDYERFYTAHGVVIGVDRERHLAYTVRSVGTEPGAASELAAPSLDRARSTKELRDALTRWKSPAVDVILADRTTLETTAAGLVPRRQDASGLLPAAGWHGAAEWRGWRANGASSGAARDVVVIAPSRQRYERVREMVASHERHSALSFRDIQQDVVSPSATRLVPLLQPITSVSAEVDAVRGRLIAWDRRMTADSEEAALFAQWERALARALASAIAPAEFVDRLAGMLPVAELLTDPRRVWPAGAAASSRDHLLSSALASVVSDRQAGAVSSPSSVPRPVMFRHPLGISDAARRWFNVGPFRVPGSGDTVWSRASDGRSGSVLKMIVDLNAWDRSIVSTAPGQSGWPASPHYSDLAAPWETSQYFPLVFSDEAVRGAAHETLTLTPLAGR